MVSEKSVLSYSNIYTYSGNLHKYPSKKTCEFYLLPSFKTDLTLKRLGGGPIWAPCGFSKNVSSTERVKP